MYPKQTTEEEIIYLLDNGYYVPVEDGRERFQIFSPHKDSNGHYRKSGYWSSIDTAKQHMGWYSGIRKEEIAEGIKEKNWKLHEPYLPIPKILEKGTKVYVKENAKEICEQMDWAFSNEVEEMLGGVFEVKNFDDGIYVIFTEGKTNHNCLPKEALIPIFEENTKEDKTEEAIALLKEKGYKIIKE